MMINSWDNVTLICGNHKNDETIEMKIQSGPHSLFYACPEYKSIYGKDHSGRSCNNRLTLVDYEDMLNILTDKIYDEYGNETNITGYNYSKKGVYYTVIKHEKGHLWVKVLNKKAISK